MPDRIRKIQVRLAMVEMDCVFVKSAKDQAKIRMTTVRMAVAKLESMCSTPTFASTAVKPAKKADSKAQKNQFMFFPSPETWTIVAAIREMSRGWRLPGTSIC